MKDTRSGWYIIAALAVIALVIWLPLILRGLHA
jgi:hypothetical protein